MAIYSNSRVRVWICSIFVALIVFSPIPSPVRADDGEAKEESVLTLDASNFDEVIKKHPFVVVEFYAPWCGHCKKLAPEYEKSAAALSKNDPPIVLAKVDANEDINKELATRFDVKGFPTLKIFRNGGQNIQEYKGPRDADGIVEYLKKQVGPAFVEIKSSEQAVSLIGDKKIFIVGLFPEFSGEEFENFTAVAEKLRSDYDFGLTSDAKLLPRGDVAAKGPVVRLFKPFDELFVDSQEFHTDNLETFIEIASVPLVTTFNKDPLNQPFVVKFFNGANAKAMLFLNFSSEYFDALKSKYHEIASEYKGKISFLIGDLDASQGAFQYFGLKEDQVPLIVLQENDGTKYLKPNVESAEVASWFKEYTDGNLKPFRKSEPIPEVDNEPVKVVVADNLHDVVYKSGKNVLIEFYAPWCGHCKKLAPILDEVAVSFENDADVIIAKFDATANDVPNDFNVQGFPTLYFSSSGGKIVQYDGDRTKEDIIDFIKKNKDAAAQSESTIPSDTLKDEL